LLAPPERQKEVCVLVLREINDIVEQVLDVNNIALEGGPRGEPEVGSRACARLAGRLGAFPQWWVPRAQRPELSRKVEWGLALPWRPPQGYQMPVWPYARRCAA
jgi:hypothetical protein